MRVLHFAIVAGMFVTLVHLVNREIRTVTPANIRVARPAAVSPVAFAARRFERIDWTVLRTLDLKRGGPAPENLPSLHGHNVAIPGFVVPLEDNAGFAGEFLVVPYFGACVHSPPPPANQMLLVKMTEGREISPPADAVWVYGVLKVESRESAYGRVAYQLDGSHIEPFRE